VFPIATILHMCRICEKSLKSKFSTTDAVAKMMAFDVCVSARRGSSITASCFYFFVFSPSCRDAACAGGGASPGRLIFQWHIDCFDAYFFAE